MMWSGDFQGIYFRVTRMELPVHDVVNTGQETFRAGNGLEGFISVCLNRWGGKEMYKV